MTITYCSLIGKADKVLLAQSTLSDSYDIRIKNLTNTINKGQVSDIIEIENDQLVTYLRTKKVIFICVSPSKHGDERPRRFLEQYISSMVQEFGSIDNILPKEPKKLSLQTKLSLKMNSLIESFDTGMYKNKAMIRGMNDDLTEIKQDLSNNIKKLVKNGDNLDEMLLVSKKINIEAKEYKEGAEELEYETRCIKPWMMYTFIVVLVLIIVYTVFAISRCGNLSIFC